MALVGVGTWAPVVNCFVPSRWIDLARRVVVERLGPVVAPHLHRPARRRAATSKGSSARYSGTPGEERRAVVAGVGADVAARCGPMLPVSAATRKMARSFRSLLKNWLGPMPTGEERLAAVGRDLAGQRSDGLRRRPGDPRHRLRGHGLASRYCRVEVEDRARLDRLAIGQGDRVPPRERRVDAGRGEVLADLVPAHGHRARRPGVPHHEVGELPAQGLGDLHAVLSRRGRRRLAGREHVDPVG